MSTGKIELSVGAVKIANRYEILTEEEIDVINNKIPELDVRVGIIEDESEQLDKRAGDIENELEQLDERVSIIEDDIEEINSSLDNKANQSDLELEKERINNLASLKEGSTTGDAELTDGRLGADGKIYDSIGEAIRGQYKEVCDNVYSIDAELIDGRVTYFGETSDSIGGAIRSQIGNLTSNLMERTDNLINVNTLNVGKSFNTSTLQYQNNSNWVSSEFIPVEPLTQYQFSCNNGAQLTCKACSINEDKNYCFALSIKAGLFTTSEDTKYVVISTNNTTTVANYNTWVLVKGDYKGSYIPYYKPKYENMIVQGLGNDEKKAISQKAITDVLNNINTDIKKKASTEHNLFSPKKYKYFMHRGFSYFSSGTNPELSAPENSIPAFENAGIIGADGIETDICETSDGYFVCMHDTNVDRTTNGTGYVINMTLNEIRNLNIDYGANIEKYSNLKVPTLDEYLEICIKYGCIPVIEIKNITNYQKLYSLLEYYSVIDNCIIICSQTGSIDKVREISDSILICKNVYSNENYVDKIDEYSKHNNIMIQFQKGEQLKKEVIQYAHSKGIITGVWTINYESQKKTYGLGVDYAIVDMLPLKP